jgi:hypothetical protein
LQIARRGTETDPVTADDWTSLVEHALWPTVVLVSVLVLRRHIGDFLSVVGGRLTKVSVMSVTVELAVATETMPTWRAPEGGDVRGLVPALLVNDSYFDTLRQSLNVPGTADYFVVDLKSDGDEWLSTRLYLFCYLLGQLKGTRAVVFVGTRGDLARSFLAVAGTDEVMRVLATAQPWLRAARLQAEANNVGRVPNDPIPPRPQPAAAATMPQGLLDVDEWWQQQRADPDGGRKALNVAQTFLQWVQWSQPADEADPDEGWLPLPPNPINPRPTWEHATWLKSVALTDGLLRNAVDPDCAVVDDRTWTAEARVRAVARTPSDFVALLTPTRRFDRLVDRRALLAALPETL